MKNELSSLSEKELVKLLAVGDNTAFEKLYIKYKKKLYLYCFSLLFDSTASEDLVQDTFIKVWETRKTIQTHMSFSAYLFTIVHNKAVSYIRRLQVEKVIISQWMKDEYSQPDESTSTGITSREYELLFEKTIESLSSKKKLIFRLSREDGLSHKEIAEQLKMSVYTVQEYISETLGYIKTNLVKHPDLRVTFSQIKKSKNMRCQL